ncbi:MAG: hypothetical protein RLZZ292_1881 [Bacteroidota bacterium]
MSPFQYEQAIANVYGKQALLDKNGYEIIPMRYWAVSPFIKDVAFVMFDDGWGAINRKGETVIPFQYAEMFWTKYGAWAKKDNKWGFINRKGKAVVPFIYDELSMDTWKHAKDYRIAKDGLWGTVDVKGHIVIPVQYAFLEKLYYQNCYKIRKAGKVGIIDSLNRLLVPCQFEDVHDNYSEKKTKNFTVQVKKKYGVWNTSKGLIVPCKYDALSISEKNIIATTDSLTDVFFSNGQKKIFSKRVYHSGIESFISFSNNEGKWGLLDAQGTQCIPPLYDRSIEVYPDRVCMTKKENKYGLISVDNQMLMPFEQDSIMPRNKSNNWSFILKSYVAR